MDELIIGDQKYVSSKRAAQMTGYAKDYIGQLCREGRVEARLVGRNWYVREAAIQDHRFGEENKEEKVKKPVEKIVEEKNIDSSWDKPKYNAEPEDFIPPVREKAPPSAVEADTATQMQSVWQEWFSTGGKKKPEPTIVEPSKMPEMSHEDIRALNMTSEDETTPTEPNFASEPEPVSEEEIVPIHINREEVAEIQEEESRVEPIKEERYEGDIATPYVPARSFLALKAALICLAAGCILFTALATGFINFNSYSFTATASAYFSGTKIINK